MSTRLSSLSATIHAEGSASALRRIAAHAQYHWHRRSLVRARELRASVLHLHGSAPKPWFGGVEVELSERRRVESRRQPFALLYPDREQLRLEVWQGRRRSSSLLRGVGATDLAPAVRSAMETLGAELLAVENLAGLPLPALATLAAEGVPMVIAVHDFAAFCERPNLIERPTLGFCGYSRDAARCARCLGLAFEEAAGIQAHHRELAGSLLAAAREVIYPSEFLRHTFAELFPGLPPERQRVSPPLSGRFAALAPRHRSDNALRRPHHPLRVAYVGAVAPHKGSRIFAAVLDRLTPEDHQRFTFVALGGGDPAELSSLSRRGVAIHGFYRPGDLVPTLERKRIDLALLLSPYPEPYGITFDECRAAGVPVITFDHGAIPERFSSPRDGWLVPPGRGAGGLLQALRTSVS